MALNRSNPFYEVVNQTRASLQSLQAMRTKFERDYLPFYDALSSTYKTGPNKKAADQAARKVERVTVLLDEMIRGGSVTAQDTSALYTLVDDLEESRQYFIEQAATTHALQARIEKITEETGISLEDLGVTPELARKAVRRDVQAGRSSVLQTIRGQFPRTRGAASNVLGGVGAAVAGPFTPFLRMGVGAGRDILGAVSAVGRMLREARQAQFAAQLRPVAAGASVEDLEQMAAAREQGPSVSAFRGVRSRTVSVEDQTRPLQHFFEKGAYRAKWTKELLEGMREVAKGRGGASAGFAGLSEKFQDLSLAIAPFIGKAGLYAGLAVGVGLSIKKFGELDVAIGDFLSAQKKRQRAADELARVTEDKLNVIKQMGIDEYSRRVGKSPTQVAMDVAFQEQRAILERRAARPWYQKTADFWLGRKGPEIQPFYERTAQIERMYRSTSQPSQVKNGPLELAPLQIPGLLDLDATMKELVQQMQKERFGGVPSAGMGNPYDSANTMLGSHADGDITLGD